MTRKLEPIADWTVWDPVTGRSSTPIRPRMMTIHTAVTNSQDIYGPGLGPGRTHSHFYNPKNGVLRQHQEINKQAYADGGGNSFCVSVEHWDGYPNGAPGYWRHGSDVPPLTDSQIENDARLFAHLVTHFGIPNRIATPDNLTGLGWHRLGVKGNFGTYNPRDRKTWSRAQTGANFSNATGKVCLPVDSTDLLTSKGWKSLADIARDDLIASVTDDQQVTFDHAELIEPFESEVVKVGNFESTPDHEWVVSQQIDSLCECGHTGKRRNVSKHANNRGHSVEHRKQWVRIPATQVKRTDTLLSPKGRAGHGLPFTIAEIRMMAWLFADGHYMHENTGKFFGVEWHFKKQRKVDRLIEILTDLGLEYKHGMRQDGTQAVRVWGEDGRKLIRILPSKRFTSDLIGANFEQITALWEELILSDGVSTRPGVRTCFSTDLESLEHIQAASAVNGLYATLWHSDGLWWLRIRSRYPRLDKPVPSRRTKVACVSTVNGTIIMRQNGRVITTGNCPGDRRIDQIQAIWDRAQDYLAGTSASAPVAPPTKPTPTPALPTLEGIEKVVQDMKATHIVFEFQEGRGTALAIANVLAGTWTRFGSTDDYKARLTVLKRSGAKVEEWKTFKTGKNPNNIASPAAFGVEVKA